jgi:hypothetical protein
MIVVRSISMVTLSPSFCPMASIMVVIFRWAIAEVRVKRKAIIVSMLVMRMTSVD